MRVFLIYPHTTNRENNAFEWFRETFSKYGIELEIYFWGGKLTPKTSLMSVSGEIIPLSRKNRPDAVILRGYNSGLSMWFEMMRIPIINKCKNMEWCRDKIVTAQVLETFGVPTPRTFSALELLTGNKESIFYHPRFVSEDDLVARNTVPYKLLQERFNHKPFVMKMAYGSKGESVFLIESNEQYQSALSRWRDIIKERIEDFRSFTTISNGCEIWRWSENGSWEEEVLLGCRLLFQEYISSSRGHDFRVWVLNGRAVSHVLRSNENSFLSNFAQGGKALYPPLPIEAEKLAIEATNAMGLEFAGIDLLLLENSADNYMDSAANCHKFTVCEVNGNPGFRTLNPKANTPIPEALAQRVINLPSKEISR